MTRMSILTARVTLLVLPALCACQSSPTAVDPQPDETPTPVAAATPQEWTWTDVEVMGHHAPWLKRRPSEIFSQQCFVSMEADEAKGLNWMIDKGLGHCILWGSDYPHFDSTYPGAYTEALATFEATGEDTAGMIVHDNPRRYMGD